MAEKKNLLTCSICNYINEITNEADSNFCKNCGTVLTTKKKGHEEKPDPKNAKMFKAASEIDPVAKIYRKNPIGGLLLFASPSIYALFLMLVAPHPWLPDFTWLTVMGMAFLYIFIDLASFGYYRWTKKTLFDFFEKLQLLRYKDIVVMDDFQSFLMQHTKLSRKQNAAIMGIAGLLGSFMAIMAHLYNVGQSWNDMRTWLWTINWFVVFILVVYLSCAIVRCVVITNNIAEKFLKDEKIKVHLWTLHEDGFGGMGGIGEIAVETALLVTTISLIIPWLTNMVSLLSDMFTFLLSYMLIFSIGLVVLLFLVAFIYPTVAIYRKAKAAKDDLMKESGERYQNMFDMFFKKEKEGKEAQCDADKMSDILLAMKVNVLMENFRETDAMKVFPLSKSIFAKLATGIIFPLVLAALEEFVRQLV
ncbi:MAG: hypothetical protein JW839_05915 [Candidatus Lokiarchaeota archaeon]|nr:hypothetical protein [Candidatus Lokiarchaeota archaeon]